MSRSFLNSAFLLSVLAVAATGCSDKGKDGSKKTASEPTTAATPEAPKKAPEVAKPAPTELPAEVEVLALDVEGSALSATIEVPKGSTVVRDSSTKLRVDFADGQLFAVRIHKGTAFTTNLDKVVDMLSNSVSGGKHEIIERTDTLLRYKTAAEKYSTESFQQLVTLGDTTWVCMQGGRPGWTSEQITQQIAACNTLKAK